VPFIVTQAADFRPALLAFSEFSPMISTAILIGMDVVRFYESTAAAGRAIDAILGGVF